MLKREAELKAAFRREMRQRLPGFLMLAYASAGAPDREIIGAGITTRWEFKHGTPDFLSHGDQELMCMRLAAAGHCRYVIWQESRAGLRQRTMIVHPRAVHARSLTPEAFC